jgi:hypothetical protein
VPISDDDLERLGRCVELARQALAEGDEPFGLILVAADGTSEWGAPPSPAPQLTDTVKALYQAKFLA